MDGQTILSDTTDCAAITVAIGTNKSMRERKAMMKQIVPSIATQSETVATLSTKINGGSSSSGKTIDKNKARPVLHVCMYCKREVYHKDRNCVKLEVNKRKRYPRWKSVFIKE